MRSYLLHAAFTAFALSSLVACSGIGKEALETTAGIHDPDDAAFHAAVRGFLDKRQGPKNSQYQYARIDLNGDGRREGLALFNLPHHYWCGWSGCTLAVFNATNDGFTFVSETSRIRGPLFVGGTATNGWEDIGVRLSDNNEPSKNVVLRYNGASYPDSPVYQETVPFDLAALGGVKIFP